MSAVQTATRGRCRRDRLVILSASQIQASHDCLRKWAWRSVRKIEAPSGPAAALGTAVHSQIEQFLKFRRPLDLLTPEGQIAATGAHLWPGRVGVDRVERPFSARLEGVAFRGIVDLDLGSTVVDHKTTSDFKWAKTPDELGTDVQATLYAHEAMTRLGGPITLRWLYYRTRAPWRTPARAVERTVTADEIAPTLSQTAERGRLLVSLARANVDPLSLPPTIATCEKYGGCAYRGLCNLSPAERLEAHMMNMADAIKKLSGTVNPGAPPPPPPPPPAMATPPTLSPDGKWQLVNNEWIAYALPLPVDPAQVERERLAAVAIAQGLPPAPGFPPADAPPPAPAANETAQPATKRGRGRPKKEAAPEAMAEPSDDHDRFVAGTEMALEGIDLMLRAFARRFFA